MDQGARGQYPNGERRELRGLWHAPVRRRSWSARPRGAARRDGAGHHGTRMSSKVLLVDDSGLARSSTRRVLEQAGCPVVEAEDGVSARERFALEKPDLV